MDDDIFRRSAMVERQLVKRGISDPAVLRAMREVPREKFVLPEHARLAYGDSPLPIGEEQTISQPYIVALMAEAANLRPTDRVLEVGTGSGYAAAVLSRLAQEIVTIERHAGLADRARIALHTLGYDNIEVVVGDGTLGWAEREPYDAIVVAAAGPGVPPALLAQLALGGRLVMPVATPAGEQELVRIVREGEGRFTRTSLGAVRFVPLVGARGWNGVAHPTH